MDIEKVKQLIKPGVRVLGISGAQGSGKSTLAARIKEELSEVDLCVLSLDDFYLTKEERTCLGKEVHPLLETRGVPGTHDVSLAVRTISALKRGEAVMVPRFDKSKDDRAGFEEISPGQKLIIFEGWCIGVTHQSDNELSAPINKLEETEDIGAKWRCYVNRCLSGTYQELFGLIDSLVFLQVPDFEFVYRRRLKQEREGARAMNEAQVRRFILFYERLTMRALEELPGKADLVMKL